MYKLLVAVVPDYCIIVNSQIDCIIEAFLFSIIIFIEILSLVFECLLLYSKLFLLYLSSSYGISTFFHSIRNGFYFEYLCTFTKTFFSFNSVV